jgi:2,4-dienoyl-CoA reductase-like NADH-dependent reductase (Old Yellow Enzyme family)
MTRARSNSEQLANADIKEYYAQRSSAGLIISEGVLISKQATGWMNAPGIYTDQMQESWKPVTDAVHKRGGLVFLQLWHMGRVSHSSLQENGQLPVAPSAIRIEGEEVYTPTGKQPYEVPRALETSEIPGVVQDYAKAAARARSAGFDGVELHGANGYLIDQFLQSKTNQRQDKYGGSIENRNRFLLEVVEAVTAEWPKGRVGVRLSPNSPYNGMGSPDFHEQFTSAIKALDRFDLAYVHVIDGLGFGFHQLGEPFTLDEARKASRHTIIGNVGYTKETAEAAIASGKADLVSFGRPFISNPDLADRFLHGWPLAPEAPMSDWFTPQGAKGYTDFPAYKA